ASRSGSRGRRCSSPSRASTCSRPAWPPCASTGSRTSASTGSPTSGSSTSPARATPRSTCSASPTPWPEPPGRLPDRGQVGQRAGDLPGDPLRRQLSGVHDQVRGCGHPGPGGPVTGQVIKPPLPGVVAALDPAAEHGLVRVEQDVEDGQPRGPQPGEDLLQVVAGQHGLRG